ncbi:Molybdenum cofactor guanylyltransferase [Moorella humiferrea]|uniref:selenium cofactor biosynthesis protein YqeC n=1 Tax=Neomoorella humiferrea TaxID=676965 RepID=UPI0030D27163
MAGNFGLLEALGLGEREIVTFVGAGGKTSALICLARELMDAGKRAVVAPTTKMLLSQLRQLNEPVIAAATDDLTQAVGARLEKENIVTCGRAVNGEGKVMGLNAADVRALAALDADYVLLEGDGAAGALLKVPAEHEPVVPPDTTLVVTVAGLRALGRPLAPPFVHRFQQAAALLDRTVGSTVTAEDMAVLLLHPRGGRKGVPEAARWTVLLNGAEDYELLRQARDIAARIIEGGGARVIVGAVATPAPVRQVIVREGGTVGIVVLAAGAGERFGGGKQLLLLAGRPMVRRVVDITLAAAEGEVVVVLGHEAGKVAAALAGLPVNLVYNPNYRLGLSTSLQAGLTALGPECRAALFVLADQPGITPAVINKLIGAYRQGDKKIIVPVYRGRRGNPVLLDRALWPQVMALQGDVGGREIIRACPFEVQEVEVDCPGILRDIDTPADYRAWLKKEDKNPLF